MFIGWYVGSVLDVSSLHSRSSRVNGPLPRHACSYPTSSMGTSKFPQLLTDQLRLSIRLLDNSTSHKTLKSLLKTSIQEG